jgi:hypothetical protein
MSAAEPRRIQTIADVIAVSGIRPPDFAPTKAERRELAEAKRTYSSRFANKMAICLANGLRERFPGVLPLPDGKDVESPAQSVRGPKKLDVNYSTPLLGLGFGVSLKAVHFCEKRNGCGFIHNRKRNDEELRVEAAGYHQRQPYAVMIAVVLLPEEACHDAPARGASSFGEWVKYLRPLSKRTSPQDDVDRYERVFIGLYARDGSRLRFFDVVTPPPRKGPPRVLLEYAEFLDEVEKSFLRRNVAEFEWADEPNETDDPPAKLDP